MEGTAALLTRAKEPDEGCWQDHGVDSAGGISAEHSPDGLLLQGRQIQLLVVAR